MGSRFEDQGSCGEGLRKPYTGKPQPMNSKLSNPRTAHEPSTKPYKPVSSPQSQTRKPYRIAEPCRNPRRTSPSTLTKPGQSLKPSKNVSTLARRLKRTLVSYRPKPLPFPKGPSTSSSSTSPKKLAAVAIYPQPLDPKGKRRVEDPKP